MRWGIIVPLVLILLLFICGVVLELQQGPIVKDFCEDKGYERKHLTNKCFKIEGDQYITKEVQVVKGVAYWKVKE